MWRRGKNGFGVRWPSGDFYKIWKMRLFGVFATFKTPKFHIDSGRKQVAKKKKGKKKKR